MRSLPLLGLAVAACVIGCSSSPEASTGAGGSSDAASTTASSTSASVSSSASSVAASSSATSSASSTAASSSSGCMPTDCMTVGWTCGILDDGCGTMLDCGKCSGFQTCGGGGVTGACGCAAPWVETQLDQGNALISGLAAAGDTQGGLHAVALDATVARYSYWYRPAGGAWAVTLLSFESEDFPTEEAAVAVDANGGVHLFRSHYIHDYKPAGGVFATEDLGAKGIAFTKPAMVMASDGTLHVGGYDYDFISNTLVLRYAQLSGNTWTTEVVEPCDLVVDPNGSFPLPGRVDIAVDATGAVDLAYYLAGPRVRHARRTAPNTWAISDIANGDAPAIQIDAAGVANIAYRDVNDMTTLATQPPGQPAVPALIGEPNLQTNWTSFVLDAAGNRHLAYGATPAFGSSDSFLRYGYLPAGGVAWAFDTVASNAFGVRQTETKLVVDPAGEPHMFYTKEYDGLFAVDRCQ